MADTMPTRDWTWVGWVGERLVGMVAGRADGGSQHLSSRRLLWLLLVLMQLIRSVCRSATSRLSNHLMSCWCWARGWTRGNLMSGWRRRPPLPYPSIDHPVVLVPGNMGDVHEVAARLRARGVTAIDARLGPVSSSHDRACELFYALVGGRVDYGACHSAQHAHRRFGHLCVAQHARWSADSPVLLLCHSQGAITALALLELLADGSFPGHATSAKWVAGLVCIASPLAGVPTIHTMPLMGVPPPSAKPKSGGWGEASACDPCCDPCCDPPEQQSGPALFQPVGSGLVALLIIFGYVAHVLREWTARLLTRACGEAWGDALRARTFDWRVSQWDLCMSDVPALLGRSHRLLSTTDTALHELTPLGALRLSRSLRAHAGVYYVAVPCQITQGDTRLALPAHTASPFHVCVASLSAATAPRESCRHSDGLVPTCAQRHPPGQPHTHLAALAPPPAEAGEGEMARKSLSVSLEPGVWCSGDAWPLDHTRSKLTEGSPTLEHALRILLPAICQARRRELALEANLAKQALEATSATASSSSSSMAEGLDENSQVAQLRPSLSPLLRSSSPLTECTGASGGRRAAVIRGFMTVS